MSAQLAFAETQYSRIGHGRLLTNDLLGDGNDRWRTGSYALSFAFSKRDEGDAPQAKSFGDVIELRGGVEFIAPSNLTGAGSGDRAWAGLVSVGLHSPFDMNGLTGSFGLDISAVGPQTGLSDLQTRFHKRLGFNVPSRAKSDAQVSNKIVIGPVLELAKPIAFAGGEFRPFVELRGGIETLARVGADVWIGGTHPFAMMARDPSSRFRYGIGRTTSQTNAIGFVLGADHTYVASSYLFPTSHRAVMEKTRTRARFGVMAQREAYGIFAGWTWVSPEFKGQDPKGQVLGSVRFFWNF